MTDWLRKIANTPITWMFIPSLMVALPMLFFGNPGFYGDDLHFFQGIDKVGTWGYIWGWMSNYGAVYRPVGITVETLLYVIFGGRSFLIYWVSMMIYIGAVCILFSQLWQLTRNLFVSAFVAMFFALFPFNSTAFLQLSSMYMVVACLLTIQMIGVVAQTRGVLNVGQTFAWGVAWLLLLLTYEQIAGLVSVICLLLFLVNVREGFQVACQRPLAPCISLCLVTILFMVMYMITPNNPKIVSLKTINQKDSEVMTKSFSKNEQESDQIINAVSVAVDNSSMKSVGRYSAILSRVSKVFGFFIDGVGYGWSSLMQQGALGMVAVFTILFAATLVFFIPITPLDRGLASVFILLGFVWSLSTIAPFLLYKAVHIPPYTLLLPGIGVGVMVIGFLGMICPAKNIRVRATVLKSSFVSIMLIFSLLQYGYFFGLREELS
ncbi:MAG: hypothetical protein OEY01_06595 [Desulfobulbaceae bacterium]|nr:hypothetical protein [Desulfobulbaceae bacterium]